MFPMKLKLQRSLAFFDIESTGINWKTDRIIDLAVIKLDPAGQRESFLFRMNPGMPIPPESTAVHGITDQDVKNERPFSEKAEAIQEVLADCDLAGYNLLRFDIPLLQAEFARVAMAFSLESRRVVDVQRIYHKKEPRDLTAALKFYCGEDHVDAHGAMPDTEATLRVLEGQLERYGDLPCDVAGLAEYTSTTPPDTFDVRGQLKWDAGNELVLNFGVFKGKRLRALAQDDPGYLQWMLRKDFGPDVAEAVKKTLAGNPPTRVPPPAA